MTRTDANVKDSDVMLLADDELDPAEAAQVEAAMGAEQRAKLVAVRDLGEAVRGHLELSADAAAPRLARMWDELDKRISIDAAEAAPAKVPAKAAPAPSFWSRFGQWLDQHRSHVMTGVLSAGAVAAIAFLVRPAPVPTASPGDTMAQVHAPVVPVPDGSGGSAPQVMVRS